MYYREFYYWCRDAVRKIRYWKDRNKVYAELYEHMMDRYESLLSKGYNENEAVKRTIEAMGSADELAPQLAAIHKPHWAYAAIATRILALALACQCFGYGIQYAVDNRIGANISDQWDPYTQGGEVCISFVEPREVEICDGYIFHVNKAALWRTYHDEPTEESEYFDSLYLQLRVSNPLPWMQGNAAIGMIWAVDNTGRYYECMEQVNSADVPWISYNDRRTGLFTDTYEMVFQDLQNDISWIELHYDRDGRNMVLHVDLTGGAVYEELAWKDPRSMRCVYR